MEIPDIEGLTREQAENVRETAKAYNQLHGIAMTPGGRWAKLCINSWDDAMFKAVKQTERSLIFRNTVAGFLQLLGITEITRLLEDGKLSDGMAQGISICLQEAVRDREKMKSGETDDADDKEAGVAADGSKGVVV